MTTITASAASTRAPQRMTTDEFLSYLAGHPATRRLGRRLAGALGDRSG
jgi:hypothetical protein